MYACEAEGISPLTVELPNALWLRVISDIWLYPVSCHAITSRNVSNSTLAWTPGL